MTQHFNAELELTEIHNQRKTMRQQTYRKSRLRRFRVELVALRKAGASLHDIALWLKQKKRIKISHTTVMRFLATLPELKSPSEKSGIIEITEQKENDNAQL